MTRPATAWPEGGPGPDLARQVQEMRQAMEVTRDPFPDAEALALLPWRHRAACRDVDSAVFYSPDAERGPARDAREAQAKAICAGCPVICECASYALAAGERHGVWGGLSERDRLALRLGA